MGAYTNFRVVRFTEGDFNLIRIPYVYDPSPNDRVHTVIEGDRLDTIAFKYYGNSRFWHIIADVNDIINPFELNIGDKLRIPGNV